MEHTRTKLNPHSVFASGYDYRDIFPLVNGNSYISFSCTAASTGKIVYNRTIETALCKIRNSFRNSCTKKFRLANDLSLLLLKFLDCSVNVFLGQADTNNFLSHYDTLTLLIANDTTLRLLATFFTM